MGLLAGVLDLAGTPESVSAARAYVKETLGPDHPALEDATDAVSEVVTNAITHSASKNGRVTLVVIDFQDFIHVAVMDAGGTSSFPRVRRDEAQRDPFAESGRGLMIVEALSSDWGVHQVGAGRVVWFEVAYDRPEN